MELVTDHPADNPRTRGKHWRDRIFRELSELDEALAPGYGIDSLGIAAGVLAGRWNLDPAEYVPKIIDAFDIALSERRTDGAP